MLQCDTCRNALSKFIPVRYWTRDYWRTFVTIRKTSSVEILLDNQPASDVANNKVKTTWAPTAQSGPTMAAGTRLAEVHP